MEQNNLLTLEQCEEICSKEYDPNVQYIQVLESIVYHKTKEGVNEIKN